MNSSAIAAEISTEGYSIARGLLDASLALRVKEAYGQLLTALAQITAAELDDELAAFETTEEALAYLVANRPLLLACYFRDPMASRCGWYRKFAALPSFYLPEVFALLSHGAVLDVAEAALGTSELSASPILYLNIKPAAHARPTRVFLPIDFLFGTTALHCDMESATAEAQANRMLNVWVPLTRARRQNGTLYVVPGSHRLGSIDSFELFRRHGWNGDEATMTPLQKAEAFERESCRIRDEHSVAVEADPGDVLFFDYLTYHGSIPVDANMFEESRWALNFRFHETGRPSGVPGLPSCPVRSRRTGVAVRNHFVWQTMQERALEHLTCTPFIGARTQQVAYPHAAPAWPKTPGEWLRLGGDDRRKSRRFPTPDGTVRVRISTTEDAPLLEGPVSDVSLSDVRLDLANPAYQGAAASPLPAVVSIAITAPLAAVTLFARPCVRDGSLILDLLDDHGPQSGAHPRIVLPAA